ncbi:MAG: hypothetical protein M4579_002841 [Chaenotheca gracillima]|nr:MAG: hypothetical protein M4579_002841 [Chaenotheca gracillima]
MASRTSETRIPDHPDLLPFLKVWYDCFGGWKEVTTANGELVRVEIICEPLRNVAPGRLPRILGERTLGQDGGGVNRHNGREETLGHSTRETGTGAASTDLSHDEASLRYDQLVRIVDAKEEITSLRATVSQVWRLINQLETETVNQTEAEHASMLINSSLPSIAGLIRCQKAELTSFLTNNAANVERDARSPVAEGDATVPSRLQSQLNDAWRHLAVASESLDQEKARGTYATAIHEEAQHRLDTAQVTFLAARNHVRRLEAQKQEADNFARTFGTREEMEQQGEDYVSPIGGMFSRAWDRYRQREEVRARNLERMAEQEQLEQRRRDHRLVELLAAEDHIMADGAINNDEGIIIIEEAASDDEGDAPELEQQADGDHGEEEEEEDDDDDAEYDEYADVGSLDMADGERPAPLEDDAMNIMLACKICYTQKASIAVLPGVQIFIYQPTEKSPQGLCKDQNVPFVEVVSRKGPPTPSTIDEDLYLQPQA